MSKQDLHQPGSMIKPGSMITNFGIRIEENKAFADILTHFGVFVCCLKDGTVQVQSPDGFARDVPVEVLEKAKELLHGIIEPAGMS